MLKCKTRVGANVLVLGYGVTGKAIVDFLQKVENCKITIFDENFTFSDLEKSKYKCVGSVEEILSSIEAFTSVITSPGFSLWHPIILAIKKRKIPMQNDIMLFLDHWNQRGKVIGVTGSNGKSTLVTLLYKGLKAEGVDVHLYGNIGRSPLELLSSEGGSAKSAILEKNIGENPVVILELSCSQLNLFEKKHYVDIGLFTNISSNHLDLYDGKMEKYASAKLKMIHPKLTRVIYYANDKGNLKYIKPHLFTARSIALRSNSKFFKKCQKLRLQGEHNKYHVSAVLTVLQMLKLKGELALEDLKNYAGLEHRIEFVCERDGVVYINDSKSTSPDATIAALQAVGKLHKTILIIGGSDKNMNYDGLHEIFEKYVRKIIILDGSANAKIKIFAQKSLSSLDMYEVGSMPEAINLTKKIAKMDDVVLLSPAASSGPVYKSFEKRGEHFKELVLSSPKLHNSKL